MTLPRNSVSEPPPIHFEPGKTPYMQCPDLPKPCSHGDECPADVYGGQEGIASFKRIG